MIDADSILWHHHRLVDQINANAFLIQGCVKVLKREREEVSSPIQVFLFQFLLGFLLPFTMGCGWLITEIEVLLFIYNRCRNQRCKESPGWIDGKRHP